MNPHRIASLTARRYWSAARPSRSSFVPRPSSGHQRPAPAFHSAAANLNPSTSVRQPAIVQRAQTGKQTALPSTSARCAPTKSIRLFHTTTKMATNVTTAAASEAALVEGSKRLAALQAVEEHLLPSYKHIGIGSGSTVVHVVDAISALPETVTANMRFYGTGSQSEQLIKAKKLRLAYINNLPPGQMLDVCFDGADEVDPALNLIKGGGACLWQEKIVATAARKFVCVADFRKISENLGTQWTKGIPIEVLPLAAPRVLDELERLGSLNPIIRPGMPAKAGECVTDNGMWIIDAPFKPLLTKVSEGKVDGEDGVWTVDGLADRLIKIVGVAEHGLFYGKSGLEVEGSAQKPVAAYFGMADGTVKVQTLEKGLV